MQLHGPRRVHHRPPAHRPALPPGAGTARARVRPPTGRRSAAPARGERAVRCRGSAISLHRRCAQGERHHARGWLRASDARVSRTADVQPSRLGGGMATTPGDRHREGCLPIALPAARPGEPSSSATPTSTAALLATDTPPPSPPTRWHLERHHPSRLSEPARGRPTPAPVSVSATPPSPPPCSIGSCTAPSCDPRRRQLPASRPPRPHRHSPPRHRRQPATGNLTPHSGGDFQRAPPGTFGERHEHGLEHDVGQLLLHLGQSPAQARALSNWLRAPSLSPRSRSGCDDFRGRSEA